MRILMSIKPRFVEKIALGEKKFEFRRVLFKRSDIDSVVVYASSPVSKIVGEFSINEILTENPDTLWEITSRASGISKNYFDSYFSGKSIAHAIGIDTFTPYKKPKSLQSVNIKRAPQSFCYIN